MPDNVSSLLVLRPAVADDIALIARMHGQSWASAYRGVLPDTYLDCDMPAERLAHWQARACAFGQPASSTIIAEQHGQAIGFACVIGPDADGSVLLDHLHVMPVHKGTGAGGAMLRAARQWALRRGARYMHLLVLEANTAAIGFYESCGWAFDRRLDDDILAGHPVVALRYVLPLRVA